MERLKFIDAAKGVLIIMVVLGHISWVAGTYDVVLNDTEIIRSITHLWYPFFMPAFFIITGFCSKWDKASISYFTQGLKQLIFPSYVITFISMLPLMVYGTMMSGIEQFLDLDHSLWIADLWFMITMFYSRIIYSILSSYLGGLKLTTIMLIMYLLGCITPLYLGIIEENHFCYVFHTLIFTPYLHVGVLLKKHQILFDKWKMMISIYLLFVFLFFVFDMPIPMIHSQLDYNYYSFIPNMLMSISATIGLIGLCRSINMGKFVEHLGKNSLVVYLVHFSVLAIMILCFGKLHNGDGIPLYQTMFIAVLSIIACYLYTLLFNTNIGRILQGKGW